jgi:hypothetical protein
MKKQAALPDSSDLNTDKRALTPSELEKEVINVLKAHQHLKTDQAIAKKVAQATGIGPVAPSTISRLRKNRRFFEKSNNGFYVLVEDGVFQFELDELEGIFNSATEARPILRKVNKIYTLKTRPYFNTVLAKKILEVFKYEHISVLSPNETDIIVLLSEDEEMEAKSRGLMDTEETKRTKKLEKELAEFCRKKREKK